MRFWLHAKRLRACVRAAAPFITWVASKFPDAPLARLQDAQEYLFDICIRLLQQQRQLDSSSAGEEVSDLSMQLQCLLQAHRSTDLLALKDAEGEKSCSRDQDDAQQGAC